MDIPKREQPTPPDAPQTVPDKWVEHLRRKQPEGSWRRAVYDRIAWPLGPRRYFTEGEHALAKALTPRIGITEENLKQADALLAEAQAIYASATATAKSAERRATTLQGAVAVATSLLVAGSALALDTAKLRGDEWRAAFAVLLVATTVALMMAGLRALSATSTIHISHFPTPTDIIRRAHLAPVQSRVQLAAETLVDYGFNAKIASWKVAYLRAAAWWFRIALALLVCLALLVGSYAIAGPRTASDATPSPTPTLSPTASPTTTPSATATPSPTASPRKMPSATATSTPIPSP
jgi:hypothetical protein